MTLTKDESAVRFDEQYFRHGCGIPYERNELWLKFFGDIAEAVVRKIVPRSALDAGCAMGFLVEGLRQRGVEAWGIDISEYAIHHVDPSVQAFCTVGSVAEPLSRRYDLIVCIEVLEHLTPREAEQAISNFCQHSDDVLFSSTPLDYKEATHFNVQPPEYWAELFAHEGFFRDVDFDAWFINRWAVRFRRVDEPLFRIVRGYERRFRSLREENLELRDLSAELRGQIARGEDRTRELSVQIEEKDQALQARDLLIAEKDKGIGSRDLLIAEKERTNQALQSQVAALLNSRRSRILKLGQKLRQWLFPRRPV